jgi:hypothetical protein
MEIFYVYRLLSNGVTFYIGKGKRTETYDRINYHLNYWVHNKNRKLTNKIKKLNGVFDIEIVFESKDEQECLNLETQLILEVGRENLCNLTDGGEGISGYKHTKKSREKISEAGRKRKVSLIPKIYPTGQGAARLMLLPRVFL